MRTRLFACLLLGTLGAIAACTSTVVGTGAPSSSGGQTSSGETNSANPCWPASGSYLVRYKKLPTSGALCPNIADDIVAVTTLVDGGVSFLGRWRDNGCEITEDRESCTYDVHCEETRGDATVTTDSTIDTSTGRPTGTVHSVASTGLQCSYDLTWEQR